MLKGAASDSIPEMIKEQLALSSFQTMMYWSECSPFLTFPKSISVGLTVTCGTPPFPLRWLVTEPWLGSSEVMVMLDEASP
jgi:hypothetical protein